MRAIWQKPTTPHSEHWLQIAEMLIYIKKKFSVNPDFHGRHAPLGQDVPRTVGERARARARENVWTYFKPP